MRGIEYVDSRYQCSAKLASDGAAIVAVGDPLGARFDAAVRELLTLLRDDRSPLWDEVVGAAKALRWRLATQPQRYPYNQAVNQWADAVAKEADRLHAAVDAGHQSALRQLSAAAAAVRSSASPIGAELLQAVEQCSGAYVVVGANGAAVAGLAAWLKPHGVAVLSTHQLLNDGKLFEQLFAVGPPRYLARSLAAAPAARHLTYYLPSWYTDRSVPAGALTKAAEWGVRVAGKERTVGDQSLPAAPEGDVLLTEEDLAPAVFWIPPDSSSRTPADDEVAARRVLLSGGYAILLDNDGERIRGILPSEPGGDRVTHVEVKAVRPGTYLLLREGSAERQTLYDAAVKLMGAQSTAVVASQARWKAALQERLDVLGTTKVRRQLQEAGVKTITQVRNWVEPTLVRPHSNQDFGLLLEWLGIPADPTYPLANALRKARAQASSNIADQLEKAVARADMGLLERNGHLRFNAGDEGFRSWIATRVIDISPHIEFVSRHDARTLIDDRRARWLE